MLHKELVPAQLQDDPAGGDAARRARLQPGSQVRRVDGHRSERWQEDGQVEEGQGLEVTSDSGTEG